MNHVSVLLGPAIEYLAIRPNGIYVDATFGAGGHTRAILERLRDGQLIALDADPLAGARAAAIADPRFTFAQANFRDLTHVLDRHAIESVDGVLFDLGVSSMQLDDAERGFSLGKPAALDMRMDPTVGPSAYEILTTASEGELADIFFRYGEERMARRIARAIVVRRSHGSLAEHDRRVRRSSSQGSSTAEAGASEYIRRRASFRRCGSPLTTSSTRCAMVCTARSDVCAAPGASLPSVFTRSKTAS